MQAHPLKTNSDCASWAAGAIGRSCGAGAPAAGCGRPTPRGGLTPRAALTPRGGNLPPAGAAPACEDTPECRNLRLKFSMFAQFGRSAAANAGESCRLLHRAGQANALQGCVCHWLLELAS